jgi:hypothetical protein
MLDRLPTELLLVIAELAAPSTAPDRASLSVDRRSWFASLASICRSLWHRVRPLVCTEVWINGDKVSALVASAVERDPSFATFTKRLICDRVSARTFEALGRILSRFSNVGRMELRNSGTGPAPLQLSAVEPLHGEPVLT